MILVDTSIWVDHLRSGNDELAGYLSQGIVLGHPLVVAELALGSLKSRTEILGLLDGLPAAPVAAVSEVRALIENRQLYQRGIGYVDASLLASSLLLPGTRLWTGDRRLRAVSEYLGVDFVT